MVDMEVLIYCKDDCQESAAMQAFLSSRGVKYRLRAVDGDATARSEWEDLDGEVTPLVVIDRNRIVRGLDCTRVGHMIGWIGC
jgi:glutaredoxin